ncbi:MAG: CBS domain-containing protein [Candidatus Tectomicrobia bacterium]|nr:CBS domain-containing protein [Candidatus Tectomicrobia bacterium]
MKAQDIMQRDVATATPDISLAQGRRLMQDKSIRHLPIVSGAHLAGIVTDRDIREAAPSLATTLSKGEVNYQMDNVLLRTCMTRNVITVQPGEDTAQVAQLLIDHRFGCVPVVEDRRLLGMITEIDCLQAFVTSTQHGEVKIKDVMHSSVMTATPENLVTAVVQQMRERRVRHVPVVTEGKKLVGILTDRDVRQAAASDEQHMAQYDLSYLLQKMTVKSIMTTHVHTVSGDAALAEAGQLMLHHKVGCLPVVRDADILEGIITVTDMLHAYVRLHETVS